MLIPPRRRALLTGATGFIGSHLADFLRAADWDVAVLARPRSAAQLSSNAAVAKVYVYQGGTVDVLDAMLACKPHVVFHLGSHFLVSHESGQIESLVSSNILFGTQLLEAMKVAGVTALVNAGTSWQNYDGDSYNPVNLYAATKQAFEDILSFYTHTAGIRSVTLRLYDSYGPHDHRRKVLRLLLDSLKTGEPLGMSPGEQVMDLVHVHDICRAFLRAAELLLEGQTGSRVYAVSSGQRLSLREIVGKLEEAASRKLAVKFGIRPYRDREIMVPWVGPMLPGWKPEISLFEGLRLLLAEEAEITEKGSPRNHE